MRWRLGAVPWLLSSGLLGAGCHSPSASTPQISVLFLSVGQGDCTVFQQGNEAILLDAGPRAMSPKGGGFDAGERIVLRRLRERGITRVRGILLSHDDLDHIGGAGAILRAFPDAVAWVGPESRIPTGARVRRLDASGRMTFGSFRIDWRFPSAPGPLDNARSILAVVQAPGMRIAMTGDSPTGVEEGVATLAREISPSGTVDVYKAGHHGSNGSGSAELLGRLRPRFVVVSSGAGNRFGHPHPEALSRYQAIGARVLRTDREGDIELRAGASGWELLTTPLDPTLARGP